MSEPIKEVPATGRRSDMLPGVKVPLSLIGPIWAILSAVAGLWYANERASRDAAIEAVALRKDVAAITSQITDMRAKLDLYYPRNEAVRDAAIVDLKMQGLDKRITNLERKAK